MFERVRHGLALTKKAWGLVRSHPGLLKLPVTGGVVGLVAFVVLGVPGVVLLDNESTWVIAGGAVLLLLGSYLAGTIVLFFNVALVTAADQVLRGQEPDVGAAKRVARSRLGAIAAWGLVSFLVGMVLGALSEASGAKGRIAAYGAAMWSLVTFLVLPVLTLEGVGPIAAIKRSTELFRRRWGQQVTGNVVIGGVAGLMVFAGVMISLGGVSLSVAEGTAAIVAGAVVLVVGVVVTLGGAVFGGATRNVFGVALYRYVAEDGALGPFTAADLAGAARQVTSTIAIPGQSAS
jgi:Family of unknown function (DUF6159)